MFTEFKDFTYEPPKMYYDKEAGEIKIIKQAKKDSNEPIKKIIRNTDDVERERAMLFQELGLNEKGELNEFQNDDDAYAKEYILRI